MVAVLLLILCGLRPARGAPYQPQTNFAQAVISLDPLKQEPEPLPSSTSADQWDRRYQEEKRLAWIKRHILGLLNLPCIPQPPSVNPISNDSRLTLTRVLGGMQDLATSSRSDLLTRAQSFYPSCDYPAEDDSIYAGLAPAMSVRFDLTLPEHVTIEAADLRVYKVVPQSSDLQTRRPASAIAPGPQEPALNVSVHTYLTQPGPSGVWAGRIQLLDRVDVPVASEEWVRLDVRLAVSAWRDGLPNRGLLLTVRNEQGVLLRPSLFFVDVNCDAPVASSPVPGILLDVAGQEDVAVPVEHRYPVLDLATSEEADGAPPRVDHVPDKPCPGPTSARQSRSGETAAAAGRQAFSELLGRGPQPDGRPWRRRHRHSRHRSAARRRRDGDGR